MKQMKYRLNIAEADFNTKNKQVIKFLTKGHQVKLTIMFKGREVNHPENGIVLLHRIYEATNEVTKTPLVDPELKGRDMSVVLMPSKNNKPQ